MYIYIYIYIYLYFSLLGGGEGGVRGRGSVFIENPSLMRIWSGAAMCGHKRAQIYGGSPGCPCGEKEQT